MDHVTVLGTADMTGHDGKNQFSYSLILYRKNEDHYLGSSDPRHQFLYEVTTRDPIHSVLIPPSEYCPIAPPATTQIEPHNLESCFIKYPRVQMWPKSARNAQLKIVKERMLREVRVYELLHGNPHPNIGEYRGCLVKDGLIRGICLTKYDQTLDQRVNPSGVKKKRFRYGERRLRSRKSLARDLASGVKHLHSHGLVHNDLKPSNIMVKGRSIPVIVDLESCVQVGQSLTEVGRTPLWHDGQVLVASPSNDLDALEEIAEWLSDREVKSYKFGTREEGEACSTCFGGEHAASCVVL